LKYKENFSSPGERPRNAGPTRPFRVALFVACLQRDSLLLF
jgi:hypothetical protein